MRIFCDGMTTEPRLAHPEGVAVHPDGPDGLPTGRRVIADLPGVLPDGLAVAEDGTISTGLIIGCHEPSQIMRIRRGGRPQAFAADPTAHLLCHPTNVAFQGTTLIAADLGRWHLTAIETDQHGLPLPPTATSTHLSG